MPISKFGLSLVVGGNVSYYQWSGSLRNYVRDNALCVVAADFDAKSRKIQRLALPVNEADAANNTCSRMIDMLPRLVSDYNARKHRTIGMRPIDVTSAIADRLLITVYNHIKIAAPARFKVGDSVCVSKFKTIFKKGYTSNWTTEVFKIIKVQQTNPVTYLLEDTRGKPIVGGFYEYELHRVANPDMYLVEKVLREKGNEVYVKWLGFDNSHNSWIHKDNVL
ncbi:hypothetical protein ALC60_08893 [Trachymyrmex zeteki]|uniref:Chromo domain-containing protein n=1 Tax=Mycetomoellerius zeteki TaxID=64791 RepID=A0A151WW56_9HYME|nr:hypothetical protein ALC60_08893 [Trachymyrmex zeteki]